MYFEFFCNKHTKNQHHKKSPPGTFVPRPKNNLKMDPTKRDAKRHKADDGNATSSGMTPLQIQMQNLMNQNQMQNNMGGGMGNNMGGMGNLISRLVLTIFDRQSCYHFSKNIDTGNAYWKNSAMQKREKMKQLHYSVTTTAASL